MLPNNTLFFNARHMHALAAFSFCHARDKPQNQTESPNASVSINRGKNLCS